MDRTMRAAFLMGPGRVEARTVAVPDLGPGGALVKVHRVGICGSDVHSYRGELGRDSEIIPGHEVAGKLVALAPEAVTTVHIGERVCIEPLQVCGSCSYCRSGLYHHCRTRRFLVGGMAEYLAVPAYTLHPLPTGMDFALGALAEPMAVVVHGLRQVGLSLGERVAVLGSGTIGLLAVVAARAAGASQIIATARYPQQQAMALALGADRVVDATNESIQALADETGPQAIDLVVETVGGQADTLRQALTLARPAGRICVLGVFSHEVSLHPWQLVGKEVSMVGAVLYGCSDGRSDFEEAIALLAAQAKTIQPLVTHAFPLAEAALAFATAADKSSGSVKVQLSI